MATEERKQFRELQRQQHLLRQNLTKLLSLSGEERPITDPQFLILSRQIAENRQLLSTFQKRLIITTLQ